MWPLVWPGEAAGAVMVAGRLACYVAGRGSVYYVPFWRVRVQGGVSETLLRRAHMTWCEVRVERGIDTSERGARALRAGASKAHEPRGALAGEG